MAATERGRAAVSVQAASVQAASVHREVGASAAGIGDRRRMHRAWPGAGTAGTSINRVQASLLYLDDGAGTAGIGGHRCCPARGRAQALQARQIIGCRHRLSIFKTAQAPQAVFFDGAGTPPRLGL